MPTASRLIAATVTIITRANAGCFAGVAVDCYKAARLFACGVRVNVSRLKLAVIGWP